MRPALRRFVLLLCLAPPLFAQNPRGWSLAANPHFEVYSQAGPESARTALLWFERLRAWVTHDTGLRPDRVRPARVIAFASAAEYQPYRLHASTDAYYVGTEGRDYMVMSLAGPRAFGIAAHEYAHLVLHSTGIQFPPWLDEGLSEVFATVRMDDRGGTLGGDRQEHSQLLRRNTWIPLSRLVRLTPGLRERLGAAEMSTFYAESWALADMLAFSPGYQPRLRTFLAALASGIPSDTALTSVYGVSVDGIASDLRVWVDRRKTTLPMKLGATPPEAAPTATSDVSALRVRLLLAGLLLDAGEPARAEALCAELLPSAPANGDLQAILGMIAFLRQDHPASLRHWARAVELGVSDDALCYRYASLAQTVGLPPDQIRPVLERAIAIRPGFDDARYSLALLERNAGRMETALEHLKAIRDIPPARAFSYWSILCDTFNALGRHEEAETAARAAAEHATTSAERARAAELAFVARTEVAVQLAPDREGRPRMVTTRVPRHTADWNPFIDPRDDVRRAEGALREIDCSGPATRLTIETPSGLLTLSIPDPSRVQMRNAPDEFTCGPQPGSPVSVVYAASQESGTGGIVRGLQFR